MVTRCYKPFINGLTHLFGGYEACLRSPVGKDSMVKPRRQLRIGPASINAVSQASETVKTPELNRCMGVEYRLNG